MSSTPTPRRRVLRQVRQIDQPQARQAVKLDTRRRHRLGQQQAALRRWLSKLKRACRQVEKLQGAISRLEKRLAKPA